MSITDIILIYFSAVCITRFVCVPTLAALASFNGHIYQNVR